MVIRRGARAKFVAPPPPVGVDLIGLSIAWSINGGAFTSPPITEGDLVRFQTPVKNQGAGTMPAGLIVNNAQLDVLWVVDNTGTVADTTWSDQDEASLAAGAQRTLTATGSPGTPAGRNYWVATAGPHIVYGTVNSNGRKVETDYTNNGVTTSFTVAAGAPPDSSGLTSMWGGVVDVDNLLSNATGISMTQVKTESHITGFSCNLGLLNDGPYPGWMTGEWSAAKAICGQFHVGVKIAGTNTPSDVSYAAAEVGGLLPGNSTELAQRLAQWDTLVASAIGAGVNGLNIDGEPYGYPGGGDAVGDNPWVMSITQQMAYDYGFGVGQRAATVGDGTVHVYSSSNGSFPGSNNDAIRSQNGGPNSYDNNKFQYFVDGLIAGAGDGRVTLSDASFHFGVQNSNAGGSWTTGAQIVNDLTLARFPGALASIMEWPDNSERSPGPPGSFFSTGSMSTAFAASKATCTGTTLFYQQHIATGDYNSFWRPGAMLAAIGSVL